MINEIIQLHMMVCWMGILLGALSGAGMGLLFHREDWIGGYGSYPRRMIRLGHISFFGLGFLNFMFAMSVENIALPDAYMNIASSGFLLGAVMMPIVCLLAAWKKPMRHLFFIPVISVFAGVVPTIAGGLAS